MNRFRAGRLTLVICLLLTGGCAGMHDDVRPEKPIAAVGPYADFSGRLLVIEPHRRWQVLVQWHADSPDRGHLRLTHAASGSVIELRWQQQQMQMRSGTSPAWQRISPQQLAGEGIVLPPWQLARLLLGGIPEHFSLRPAHEPGKAIWESRTVQGLLRLEWTAASRRLVMTDLARGRRATLIIDAGDARP